MSFSKAIEDLKRKKTARLTKPTEDPVVELVHQTLAEEDPFWCPWNGLAFRRIAGGLILHVPIQTHRFLQEKIRTHDEAREFKILIRMLKRKVSPESWKKILADLQDLLVYFK